MAFYFMYYTIQEILRTYQSFFFNNDNFFEWGLWITRFLEKPLSFIVSKSLVFSKTSQLFRVPEYKSKWHPKTKRRLLLSLNLIFSSTIRQDYFMFAVRYRSCWWQTSWNLPIHLLRGLNIAPPGLLGSEASLLPGAYESRLLYFQPSGLMKFLFF